MWNDFERRERESFFQETVAPAWSKKYLIFVFFYDEFCRNRTITVLELGDLSFALTTFDLNYTCFKLLLL